MGCMWAMQAAARARRALPARLGLPLHPWSLAHRPPPPPDSPVPPNTLRRRRENIGARVTAKADKKKAKREKKLLRAGFEGRKAGFIATPKK
jgi:hypothetical protein